MAKIINKETGTFTLPTGHVIPRLGTLETTNDNIRSPDNWPNLSGRAAAGQIVIEFDAELDPSDPENLIVATAPTPAEPTAVLIFPETEAPKKTRSTPKNEDDK